MSRLPRQLSTKSGEAQTTRCAAPVPEWSWSFLLHPLVQPAAQLLKTRQVEIDDLRHNGIRRGAVVGVAGEIAVLKHQHPGFAMLDQAQAEGFTQRVPSKLISVFKRLDQPLLLAFIQRWRLQESSRRSRALQ